MTDRPTGQRFSLTYLPQSDPKNDSETMRYRLSKLLGKDEYQPRKQQKNYTRGTSTYVPDHSAIHALVEEEIGVQFRTAVNGKMYPSWVQFLRKIPPHKMLDTITVAYKGMVKGGRQGDFISQANRILQEENIAYEIDEEGGVHPVIDRAYAATKQAAILGMSEPRYALSLARIEEVDGALMASSPNYIQSNTSNASINRPLCPVAGSVIA